MEVQASAAHTGHFVHLHEGIAAAPKGSTGEFLALHAVL